MEAYHHFTCNEWIYEGSSHGMVASLTTHLLHKGVLGDVETVSTFTELMVAA